MKRRQGRRERKGWEKAGGKEGEGGMGGGKEGEGRMGDGREEEGGMGEGRPL